MSKSWIKLVTMTLVFLLSGCSALNTEKNDISNVNSALTPKLSAAYKAYDEGRLSTSETMFIQYLKKHPNYVEGWFKLGNIYFRTGQYTAAVTAYENVLQQQSNHPKAWYNLSLTRIKQAELTLAKGESQFEPGTQERLKLTELKNKIKSGVRQFQPKKNN